MKIGFRNTYANVAATAALVLTLGGTGYAATSAVTHDRAPGGLPGTLGHGKTLTGSWGQSAQGTSTNDIQTDTISLPIHLKKNVTVIVRQDGASPTVNCPGTAKHPKARPGRLCVYVGAGTNHDAVNTYSPVDGSGSGNYKYGAVVYWRPQSAPGFVYASGTWAVTAK